MKLSNILNILSAIITFMLVLFLTGRVVNTACFQLFDYFVMFGTLFANIGINILSALGR